MSLLAVTLLIFLVSPSLTNPVGFPSADPSNYYNDYNEPFGYFPPGYPKTVDMARENFVRDSGYGTTEVGTRNELTIRPTGHFPGQYPNQHIPYHWCHNHWWCRNYYPSRWCCPNQWWYPNNWCWNRHFPRYCCFYPFYRYPACRNYYYGNERSNSIPNLLSAGSAIATAV